MFYCTYSCNTYTIDINSNKYQFVSTDILDRIMELPENIRLGWKSLKGTNTLAYLEYSYTTAVNSFISLAPVWQVQSDKPF